MKKIITLIMIIVLSSSALFSQTKSYYTNTFCLNAGLSAASYYINGLISESATLPAIQFTYDIAPVKFLSIGIAASYQRIDNKNHEEISTNIYNNITNQYNYNNYDFTTIYTRTNIACRILFHYGPQNVRMYSGFRVGTTIWKYSTTGDTPPDYDATDKIDDFFPLPLQLIPFGVQSFITENIGINAELGLGAPHYFSMGICFRI